MAEYFCTKSDIEILIGEMDTGRHDLDKWGEMGREELELALAGTYVTPIVFAGEPAAIEISKMALKRINANISAGRFLLSSTSGAQQEELHTYGNYLVSQGHAMIAEVLDGNPALAAEKSGGGGSGIGAAPLAMFADAGSQVEAFSAFTLGHGAGGMLLDPRRGMGFVSPKQAGG